MKIMIRIDFLFLFIVYCHSGLMAQNFITITKEEHDDASFTSLEFLKKELENVKVIGLGESRHIMGATFTSKVQLIKYLHKECGFNVIAFEAPLYNLTKAFEEYRKGNVTIEELFKNNSGVFYFEEIFEIYKYLEETQNTPNPLILTGFDESVFYYGKKGAYDNVIEDYISFMDSLNLRTNESIKYDSTFIKALQLTARRSYSFKKIPEEDTLIINKKFKEIRAVLHQNKEKALVK